MSIDDQQIAIMGMSDGASLAMSMAAGATLSDGSGERGVGKRWNIYIYICSLLCSLVAMPFVPSKPSSDALCS